jgi:hypothetical protein
MNSRPARIPARRLVIGLQKVGTPAGGLAHAMQNHLARGPNRPAGLHHLKIMNQLILKETWSSIKERLKLKYPSLTDNDLAYIQDREDEMLEQIQRKTGESRVEIEKCLREECAC